MAKIKLLDFERSFAASPRAANWSSQNECSPRDISLRTGRKYLFLCDVCYHVCNISPDKIGSDRWCSYCSGNRRCSSEMIENCAFCWAKCFASHPKASCWSGQNLSRPCEVSLNSNKKYLFTCDICLHTFSTALNDVSG